MCKCLYCYKPLKDGQQDFHPACAKKFFGEKEIPTLEYTRENLDELAKKVIQSQTSLTGVQPNLSLNLDRHEGSSRLTIVDCGVTIFSSHKRMIISRFLRWRT